MSAAHHLEDALRNLKLFGMLDTLPTRLAQAGAGELGQHPARRRATPSGLGLTIVR